MNGWKTFITNSAVAGLSALEFYGQVDFVEADEAAVVAGIIAAGNIILRFFTNSPIFKKTED